MLLTQASHEKEQAVLITATDENRSTRPLYIWLFTCCALVFALIIIGAITRLTESGLSIVEWNPVMGIIPPLSAEQWQSEFDLYKQSPEFIKKNFWMTLADFKQIYFWEWFHRFFARLIGFAFAIPFIAFLVTKKIPKPFRLKLFGIFLLGAAQGFMGWYMVKSGLVDQPAVSHFRLAAHLGLALLIYSTMLWQGMTFLKMEKKPPAKPSSALLKQGSCVLLLVCITIVWGAFTAGLDAGLIYNDTFPHMGNAIIPSELTNSETFWLDLANSYAGVQFTHRWLAIFTTIAVLFFCLNAMIKHNRNDKIFPAIAVAVLCQLGLGIATLTSIVAIELATLHQAGAVILLTLFLIALHNLKKDQPQLLAQAG